MAIELLVGDAGFSMVGIGRIVSTIRELRAARESCSSGSCWVCQRRLLLLPLLPGWTGRLFVIACERRQQQQDHAQDYRRIGDVEDGPLL